MTTQVIFKIEKNLKDKAIKKAKSEGIALASMLKMATKAFIAGEFTVGLIQSENFNSKTSKEIKESLEDIKKNKNLSPRFKSAKEAIKYLRK
jgi:hypothetical protein